MWIAQLFSRHSGEPSNALAPVSYAEAEQFGAVSASEQRQIPLASPGGIRYCPKEGDQLLLVDAGGSPVCAGVITSPTQLQPGELLLDNGLGAKLLLDQQGNLHLGNLVITPQGELRFPGGATLSGSPTGELLINGTVFPTP